MACGVWAALTAALALCVPGAWAAAAVEVGAPATCSADSNAAASSSMLQRDQMLSILMPAKSEEDGTEEFATCPLPCSYGCLEALDESTHCPDNVHRLKACDKVQAGELCEADGECGTNTHLNNCGSFDVYRKSPCPTDRMTCPDGSSVDRDPATCKFRPCSTPRSPPVLGCAVEEVPASECPPHPHKLDKCDHVQEGLCEGDGECGTKNSLNNCPPWDIYRKAAPTPAPTPAPRGVPKDVEGFLLLAGAANDHVNLTTSALEELGWKKGVLVADTTHAAQGMLDHAQTWSKGDKCLAAFASTNDAIDMQQVVGGFGAAPVSFCGFNMHAGVVDEMLGFMKAPNWAEFIQSLHDPACKSVTVVGHSLGGSLATLFAACANKGDPALGFGQRSDYDLVTFAPFAISAGPLYSGRPGQSFSGARYNIVGDAGGRAGPEAALPRDTRPFRASILQFAISLAQMLEQATLSQFIRGQMEVIRNWTDDSSWDDAKEAALRQHWIETIFPVILPLSLKAFALSADPPAFLTQFVTEAAKGGFLFYAYDMVGALSQPFGFQHALQDFQPMPHPFKTPKGVVYDKIPASEGAPFPKGDIFQIMLSILANGGHLPNHQPCCYSSSNSDCGAKFTDWSGKLTVDSFACRNSVFR